MATKNFDLARKEQAGEPLTFVLGGQTFVVPLPIPGMALMDLAASADNEGAEAVSAFVHFLLATISQEQQEEFRRVCDTERVGFVSLVEIVTWLVEEGTAVPFEKLLDGQGLPSSSTSSSNTKSDLKAVAG